MQASTVSVKTGSEGPIHDPYGYEEITVTRQDGHSVTIHQGLAVWVKVDDCEIIEPREHERRDGDEWDAYAEAFETHAGISVKAAKRAWTRVTYPDRCPDCGCRETRTVRGHPGETFDLCVQCDRVVQYDFDESAII